MQRAQVNYIESENNEQKYRLYYTSWGNPDNYSKAILCLHGLNRNSRDWDYAGEYFAAKGFYVVALDIAGRGNSAYLVNYDNYEITQYAIDVIKFINILQLNNLQIIGTSMGGLIALSIAAKEDLFEKIILNDIGPEIEKEGLLRIASYTANQPTFMTLTEAGEYYKSISKEFGALPDDVWEHMVYHSFQKNSAGNYEAKRDVNLAKPLAKNGHLEANIQLWDLWEQVRVPVLVIRGSESDLLSVATVNKMQEIHELTEMFTVEKAGHAPFIYEASQLDKIYDFINK